MQMLDVMRRVNSEHEVRFLLSAYVETLRFYDAGRSLPQGVTMLPLAGVDDVRERFEALLDIDLCGSAAHRSECVHAIVREAAEIFGAALGRLQILQKRVEAVPVRDVELGF
jgi:hypothetical protein